MRFFKKIWGIIWEFDSIGEYASFMMGRLLGVITLIVAAYLLIKCS